MAAPPEGEADLLQPALARNLWRGATPPAGSAAALARLARAQAAALERQADADLAAGRVVFLPAPEAAQAGAAQAGAARAEVAKAGAGKTEAAG
jgi:hypothetical protein